MDVVINNYLIYGFDLSLATILLGNCKKLSYIITNVSENFISSLSKLASLLIITICRLVSNGTSNPIVNLGAFQ